MALDQELVAGIEGELRMWVRKNVRKIVEGKGPRAGKDIKKACGSDVYTQLDVVRNDVVRRRLEERGVSVRQVTVRDRVVQKKVAAEFRKWQQGERLEKLLDFVVSAVEVRVRVYSRFGAFFVRDIKIYFGVFYFSIFGFLFGDVNIIKEVSWDLENFYNVFVLGKG